MKHHTRFIARSLCALACTAILACLPHVAAADPAANVIQGLRQPDGRLIQARLWGDEYANGWETLDGYTIYFDKTSGYWTYATLDASGDLTSSGVRVGTGSPSQSTHLRPSADAMSAARLRLGGTPTPSLVPGWATGNTNVLVIMVQFPADAADPDGPQPAVNASFTAAQVQANLFGATPTGPGNMTDYYDEISFGNLHLIGTVVGPFTVANDKNDYDDGPNNEKNLVKEAIQLADPTVDFSQFDNDGDGEVDMVAICYAGNGPDNGNYVGADPNTNNIWPHASSIASINVDGGARHVSQYFMAPELLNSTPRVRTIGVYCHEFGHKIGLPDLYDTDGSSEGVGHWCLMGSGSWCSNTPGFQNGESPSHMSAWCKYWEGWMTPTDRTDQQVGLNVPQAETNASAIRLLANPGGPNDWPGGTGEYFLIENRQRTGFDIGLDGCGLLVWHIDESKDNNKSEGHTAGTHRLVDLEEAGGTPQDLDGGPTSNRGDADDPYPGSSSNKQWDDNTTPNAKLYSGSNSDQRMRVLATGCSSSMAISLNNLPPVADAGPDQLNVECTSPAGAVVNLNGTGSSDPDGDALTYTWTAPGIVFSDLHSATPSATFPDGSTIVTLTVSDGIETDTDQMTVQVVDTTPPTISCPANITVECTSHSGTPATDPAIAAFLAAATGSDLCGNVTITNDAPAVFPHGTTTVTFTATDEATLTATCTADVNVVDTTPPTISVTLNRDALWPPNHKMADIIATVEVEDICDPNPTFVLWSITSNEPDNGLGDGDTPHDIGGAGFGTPDVMFQLRSERSGTGSGRVYTVIYRASDDDGNTAKDTAYVRVPHNQSGAAAVAAGFSSDGGSLNMGEEQFSIVLPTAPGQDASHIDAAHALLGNTEFVLAPLTSWVTRPRADGTSDLVLVFSTQAYRGLITLHDEVIDETGTVQTPEKLQVPETGDVVTDEPEPIGLHYAADGVDFVIDDVFALGAPVDVGIAPVEEGGAPATAARQEPVAQPEQTVIAPKPTASSFDGRMLTLAAPGRVRFDVFTVLGRRVRTVVDGEFGIGTRELKWDGMDAGGRRAPNGIYFYRVTGPGLHVVRKVSLVR